MSNFCGLVFHPNTGKLVNASFLDDYFGRHKYGVCFKDVSEVIPREKVRIPTLLQEQAFRQKEKVYKSILDRIQEHADYCPIAVKKNPLPHIKLLTSKLDHYVDLAIWAERWLWK